MIDVQFFIEVLVGGLLSGGTAQVALRFSSLIGDSQVDDIFIDPRMN